MLLRAAIVILVMLNLGAGAWWVWQPATAAGASADSAADAPGLRLVGEAASAVPPGREATAARMPTSEPGTRPELAGPHAVEGPSAVVGPDAGGGVPAVDAPRPEPMPPADASATPPANAAAVCLRFGPFADEAARQAARARLQAVGVAATARDSGGRGVRGWKVYLPPLASREAAQATAQAIRASGVTDLFVMGQGDEANSIALGRFSSEEGARRRQAELSGKGVQATIAPVGGELPQAWLDAQLPPGMQAENLPTLPRRAVACRDAPSGNSAR